MERDEEDVKEAAEDSWCAAHLDHGCLTGLTSAIYIDESSHLLPSQSSSFPSHHSSAQPPAQTPAQTPRKSSSPSLPTLSELSPTSLPVSAGYEKAGLYILSRTNKPVKINIPADHLAFQTGEALEIITRGCFRAVPHFVKGPTIRRRHEGRGVGQMEAGKGDEDGGRDGRGMGDREGGRRIARNTLAVFTRMSFFSSLFSLSPLISLTNPPSNQPHHASPILDSPLPSSLPLPPSTSSHAAIMNKIKKGGDDQRPPSQTSQSLFELSCHRDRPRR